MYAELSNLTRGTLVVISHSLILYLLSTPKPDIKHPAIIWGALTLVMEALVVFVSFFLGYYLWAVSFLYFVLIISYFIMFLTISSGLLTKNIFIFMSYSAYFMLSVGVVDLITTIFFNGNPFMQGIIRLPFTLILIVLIKWPLKPFLSDWVYKITKGWGILAIFSTTATAVASIISIAGLFLIDDKVVLLWLLLLFSFMIIASIAIIIRMIRLLDERQTLLASKYQEEILKNELKAEAEFVDSAKQFRHDQRHHDMILLELIESGKDKEAIEYLKNHTSGLNEIALVSWCENITLNAIIRLTARKCADLSIPFTASVIFPEKTELSNIEIGTVFGNLLENAVEASVKTKDPRIEMSSRINNGNTVIAEIRNKTDVIPSFVNGFPLTTKQNGGTGIKSVRNVLEKHNGLIRCFVEDNTFCTQIIFPL